MTTPTVQPVYGAVTALTNAVTSLGSSGTFTAGYASATFDNSSSLYDDVIVSGYDTVGTTPTVNTQILIFVVEPIDVDAGVWPDVFTGSTGAKTLTSEGLGHGFLKLGAVIDVDAVTSNVAYPFNFSVREACGKMPKKFQLFTVHNTAVNFNSTGSNHVTKTQGLNDAIPSV